VFLRDCYQARKGSAARAVRAAGTLIVLSRSDVPREPRTGKICKRLQAKLYGAPLMAKHGRLNLANRSFVSLFIFCRSSLFAFSHGWTSLLPLDTLALSGFSPGRMREFDPTVWPAYS